MGIIKGMCKRFCIFIGNYKGKIQSCEKFMKWLIQLCPLGKQNDQDDKGNEWIIKVLNQL